MFFIQLRSITYQKLRQLLFLLRGFVVASLFCFVNQSDLLADQPNAKENQIKSAFILNFAKYISWPEKSLENNKDTFVICHIGYSPLMKHLRSLEQRMIHSRSISVISIDHIESSLCHIAYVPNSELRKLREFRSFRHKYSVLTISSSCNLADIGLYKANDTMQFEVNAKETAKKGFHISAQMLKIAARVVKD